MQSLGPFDPLTLSAGVLTTLAYDILKHRAMSLESTAAGKMLKWAGIIEPNFDERLRETLSKTLGLYFKEHPQYALSGIADFFRDATVAHQIGDYILDHHSINHAQLQLSFEQHFRTAHSASKILFQRRGLSSKKVIDDFIKCYRRVLGEQLSIPEMGILLDILDQTTTTVNEIKASEQRLKDHISLLIETNLSPQVLGAAIASFQSYNSDNNNLITRQTEPLLLIPSHPSNYFSVPVGFISEELLLSHSVNKILYIQSPELEPMIATNNWLCQMDMALLHAPPQLNALEEVILLCLYKTDLPILVLRNPDKEGDSLLEHMHSWLKQQQIDVQRLIDLQMQSSTQLDDIIQPTKCSPKDLKEWLLNRFNLLSISMKSTPSLPNIRRDIQQHFERLLHSFLLEGIEQQFGLMILLLKLDQRFSFSKMMMEASLDEQVQRKLDKGTDESYTVVLDSITHKFFEHFMDKHGLGVKELTKVWLEQSQ